MLVAEFIEKYIDKSSVNGIVIESKEGILYYRFDINTIEMYKSIIEQLDKAQYLVNQVSIHPTIMAGSSNQVLSINIDTTSYDKRTEFINHITNTPNKNFSNMVTVDKDLSPKYIDKTSLITIEEMFDIIHYSGIVIIEDEDGFAIFSIVDDVMRRYIISRLGDRVVRGLDKYREVDFDAIYVILDKCNNYKKIKEFQSITISESIELFSNIPGID